MFYVIVGNIGTVEITGSEEKALETFNEYVDQSKTNYGRAAGESVTIFKDGEPYKEFIGEIDLQEEE